MLPFQNPYTMMISGTSLSGKTTFVTKLLQHMDKKFTTHFREVIWCYGAVVTILSASLSKIRSVKGILDMNNFKIESNYLIILDDLMNETNGDVSNLFTKYAHHKNYQLS